MFTFYILTDTEIYGTMTLSVRNKALAKNPETGKRVSRVDSTRTGMTGSPRD